MTRGEFEEKCRLREALYGRVAEIKAEIVELETELGFDEIVLVDFVDGTNLTEYQCIRCKTIYQVVEKGVCPKCHPLTLERENSTEL